MDLNFLPLIALLRIIFPPPTLFNNMCKFVYINQIKIKIELEKVIKDNLNDL
jgi:hypothetical protein